MVVLLVDELDYLVTGNQMVSVPSQEESVLHLTPVLSSA